MNVDLEKNDKNQENFEKKKKIVLISLSAALVFITLIAGLFFAKKSKESSYKNNDLEKVIDNEKKNNENDNDNKNEEIIVNRSEYFFEKTLVINILSFLIIGILFFFWENDKLLKVVNGSNCSQERFSSVICGIYTIPGTGLFGKANWFGIATLGSFITITLLVEIVLHLLIGSISYFLNKDKSKRYLHTLGMSLRKRIQYFSSFSIAKTLFITLIYLIIAIFARVVRKYHPCCCRKKGEIVVGHGTHCCCGYWIVKPKKRCDLCC